jgi:PAS domain S-box-containing protein
VARDGRALVISELGDDLTPEVALLKEWGIRACACLPLVVGERFIGTIAFGSRNRSEFREDELGLMKTVADHVAIAIHRKMAADDLRKSEDRYRAFVETSLEAIWRLELDEPIDTSLSADEQIELLFKHAYYAEANDALARLYGFTKAVEVVGMRMSEVESATHSPTVESFRRFISEGYSRHGEESYEKDRHGEIRRFLNNYVGIVEDGKLVRIWGSSLDVTERKQAEEALNERTALLTAISENAPDLIFAKDKEGRMIFANSATLRVVELPEDELIGRTDLQWARRSEQAEEIVANDRRVLSEGKARTFEEHVDDRSFESVKAPLRDLEGNIIGIVGVARDVTELRRTQGALRESEERFRLMADSAPVLIWLAEPDRGCTWVNQQWLAFTGRSLEEELGDGWTNGIHPDDRAACQEIYTRECARRVPFQMDYRLRGADGEYRWVLDCAAPRFGSQGEFLGYLGSCVDITQRKEYEAELSRAKAAAEAASRAKDDFLAMLSHELRTPLTPVMLMASELVNSPDLDEQTREDWRLVHKNIALQARLIDDLLDLTRVAKGKLVLETREVDLHRVLQDALETVRAEAEQKKQALDLELSASPCTVRGDAGRLQQVFWNVLQNAVKFTPASGTITVRSSNSDGRLRIQVRDTGLGMTTEELARIFKTFSQGDHAQARGMKFGGLGLGLAITRELVELHKGQITAASDGRNLGATFTIELPVC